jgi:hypothetical protein
MGVSFFVLGVIGTWLFAAVDACRTAQLMRAVWRLTLKRTRLRDSFTGIQLRGVVTLVALGLAFLSHTLLGIQFPVRAHAAGGPGNPRPIYVVRLFEASTATRRSCVVLRILPPSR